MLSSIRIVGRLDPAFPADEATLGVVTEEDLDARRAQLPPLSSIPNLAVFETLAEEILGKDSTAWRYISSWSDDGVCKYDAASKSQFPSY